MTLLSVQNVTKKFGGVTALDGVSLSVQRGCLLGFIGPNGAGKTTLMRIITGRERLGKGRIIFDGVDITFWRTDKRIRAGIGLSQQIVRPLRSFNLLDNVALAAGGARLASPFSCLMRIDRREERSRARELLEIVGIADAAEAMPPELPLGYLKRLEVARAMALRPRLLLLDEPLAGLNQTEARAMADLILSLVDHDRSIVLIEHNIREVARICPLLYVQDNGRPLLQGPTAEVMASDELRRAYLGQSGGERRAV